MEATAASTERTFYNNSGVIVTQSRYIAGSKTYAVRNISSVSNFKIPANRGLPILIIAVGILLLLFSDDLKVVGFIAGAIGLVWFLILKDQYSVRISTNAAEADSLTSNDNVYIQQIVDALNDAIIHQGT